MLSEDVALRGFDEVAEDDGIGNLHVQGHHQLLLIAILDLLCEELLEGGGVFR